MSSKDDAATTLARIDARLERLERRLDNVATISEQAPAMAATAADIFDQWAAQRGDVDQRLRGVAALLDTLSEPRTLDALHQLVDMVASGPDIVATACDIGDDAMRKIGAEDVELDRLVPALQELGVAGARLATVPELPELVHEMADNPELLPLAGLVGQAMTDAAEAEPSHFTAWGLLKALREPEVQRAAGFMVEFARRLGRRLEEESA